MQDINNQQQVDGEQEIDYFELVFKLWKSRWFIIKCCIVGVVLGLVVGYSIPERYKAGVTIVPEVQQKTGSGVNTIASMMGVSLNNNIDAIGVDMFPDLVHSTPFIFELFDLPVTFERNDSTITAPLLEYMKSYQKRPWWKYVTSFPFKVLRWCVDLVTPDEEVPVETETTLDITNLPKRERGVVAFFAENIIVTVDKKSHKTRMTLEMQDPLVVSAVMQAVTDNLQNYISNYRTSKARQDVENLEVICEQRRDDYYKAQQAYASYIDSNRNVILQSANAERDRLQQEMNLAYQVYSQVATNLEGARIQAEQAKPVFVILEHVTTPINKCAPSKAKVLVIFVFLAACFAAAWTLFGVEFLNKIKQYL